MTKLWYEVRPPDADRHTVPIGKPMEGVRALVCDAQGQPCGIGALGEIYIRTPFRSLGYYKRLDLTKCVFIQNPLNNDPNDLLYKTGDLGRILEDGNFEFLGRRDRQVKIRGVRIELAEVENALREHESVRDLAVIDRDDDGGGKCLCAYVVLHPVVPVSELREFLCERLPQAAVPSVYISLDTLPRTVSGKIDRSALPLTPDAALKPDVPYVAPQTPTEEALAAIWRELMQIAPPGIHYNFFAVGGHSLLAMQVIARVEAAFGVCLPLQTFLTAPTIHALAQHIEATILDQDSAADELLDLLDVDTEDVNLKRPTGQPEQTSHTRSA
jgi:acyl carrier protein